MKILREDFAAPFFIGHGAYPAYPLNAQMDPIMKRNENYTANNN